MVSEIAIWVFWIGLFIFVVFFVKNHYDEIEEQERDRLESIEFNKKVRSGEIILTPLEKSLINALNFENPPHPCDGLWYSDCINSTHHCSWEVIDIDDGFCIPDDNY